jgi:hypothetical protein
MGAADNPVYLTLGASFKLRTCKLDYAASFHEVLGYTPHLSLSFPQK